MVFYEFLTGQFLYILPIVVFNLFLLLAIFIYFNRTKNINIWLGIAGIIFFKIFYAIYISVAQYYVWKNGGKFTEVLVNLPIDSKVPQTFITELFPALFQSKLGYMIYYSIGRYGVNLVWSIIGAFVFWMLLRLFKKYNERFFDVKEVEIGLLCSLIVGWPNIVLFIPLTFIFIILVSITRGLLFKELYTTIGIPFLLATISVLIFGEWLITSLGLSVLKI